MKFSILIAQYNNGKYFKECYESIIKQTYQNWEAIVLDDCSTDNSMEVIKEMVGDDKRFNFFYNSKNRGCGYTKNKCVKLATGDICGFLDPDDAIVPKAIELMVQKHLELPKVGMIYSKLQYVDENFNYTGDYKNAKIIPNFDKNFYNQAMEINHFVTFKKEIYQQTEGINTYFKIGEDLDLYLKLYEKAEVYFLDEFLYLYRKHQGGISNFKNVEKASFWRWVVNIHTAERRNQNLEENFFKTYINRNEYNTLKGKYNSLKKFEKLNGVYLTIKSLFKK